MSQTRINSLRCMRELLSDRSKWGKHLMKQTKWPGTKRETVAYCLIGAGRHCDIDDSGMQLLKDVIAARRAGFGDSIVSFNDASRTKHEDVLAVIDAAIEKANSLKS